MSTPLGHIDETTCPDSWERCGTAGYGRVRQGTARQGVAWHGMAWQGKGRPFTRGRPFSLRGI
jgi:hypothetical protein